MAWIWLADVSSLAVSDLDVLRVAGGSGSCNNGILIHFQQILMQSAG